MARIPDPRPLRRFDICLKLREGEDDDLIQMLEKASNRAVIVKRALRGHIIAEQPLAEEDHLDDLLDEFIL